jgi:fructosamine-3-kinase
MKRIIIVLFSFFCFIAVNARLQIRNNYFNDRVVRSGHRPIHSVADAEDEVNRLRMDAINKYDSGEYVAGMHGWQDDERRALDIQTKLGYTVPERYTWGD